VLHQCHPHFPFGSMALFAENLEFDFAASAVAQLVLSMLGALSTPFGVLDCQLGLCLSLLHHKLIPHVVQILKNKRCFPIKRRTRSTNAMFTQQATFTSPMTTKGKEAATFRMIVAGNKCCWCGFQVFR